MGRRITLSLSPLPGRARLFFRRMYFSVCPVVLPIGLAERPHSPNLTTNHVLCILRAVQTTTFFSSDDVMVRYCSVFFGKKFKRRVISF